MPASKKDGRRLTGYRGDVDSNIGHIQHNSLYDDDMDDYHHYTGNDDDVYEEYDEDLDDGEVHNNDDDTGSELSIPDANIDFDMVYALHTFAATVEGQASVVRGDALTLLDDSNSYWWLVKVLKTAEVGYIPAENIETPHERLARLNSHRNIELTRKDIQDVFPAPPKNKSKQQKRVTLAKGVQFQSQIIYGSSDDEDFEAEFEQWNERMRSDDSSDNSSDDSDDPYHFYDDSAYMDTQPTSQQQVQHPTDMYSSYANPDYSVDPNLHSQAQTAVYDHHSSADSDIINEHEDRSNNNRNTLDIEDETIKISLTPSIARGYNDTHRDSDGSIQTKLKKTAKLDKIFSSDDQNQRPPKEKKEKSGIRKFFSRGSKDSKEKKRKNSSNKDELERQLSGNSSLYDTASISSQSTGISDRDRMGSVDSTMQQQQPTKLKVYAGNDFGSIPFKEIYVYNSTTAAELIHNAVHEFGIHDTIDLSYQDYYLMVKNSNGEEYTLIPSDKPLEIYYSLTASTNTPMPSLKKARRISQLMGSDNTHMGGPKEGVVVEDTVKLYLYSKTKRIEDGEIQIKVSLVEKEVQHKLIKIGTGVLVKDAVNLILEKFHILNGIATGDGDDAIRSLRLEGSDEVIKYQLSVHISGQEHALPPDEKLIGVFGDQLPSISYRRNSNPDRSSVTVNIPPPDDTEIYFILRPIEGIQQPERYQKDNLELEREQLILQQQEEEYELQQQHLKQQQEAQQKQLQAQHEEERKKLQIQQEQYLLEQQQQQQQQQQQHQQQKQQQKQQQQQVSNSSPVHPNRPHRPVRQDTPLPHPDATQTNRFYPDQPLPQYQPQIALDTHDMMSSPEDNMFDSADRQIAESPDSTENIIDQLDEAVHKIKKSPRPKSTDSTLFCNDFGMNDLMVMIRGAARSEEKPRNSRRLSSIRSEISVVFKDTHGRLDQLEKELDRLMSEALRVYD